MKAFFIKLKKNTPVLYSIVLPIEERKDKEYSTGVFI